MKKTKKFKKVTEKELQDALLQEKIKEYNNQSLADFGTLVTENNILISEELKILKASFRALSILQGSVCVSLIDLNDNIREAITLKKVK